MDLQGKTVVVVGLAQTGVALAKFCLARGARVTITDKNPRDKLEVQLAQLEGLHITYELGGHAESTFTNASLVVMSPGVPQLPEMHAARKAGVEVIAEIELA